MREIDTGTTGLDPLDGHRVVGTVELINRSPTGKTFHRYLCPQHDIPADAVTVRGLTAEFLANKPLFADVADGFLAFVGDAPLVAHNPSLDIAFLNAERKRAAKPTNTIRSMLISAPTGDSLLDRFDRRAGRQDTFLGVAGGEVRRDISLVAACGGEAQGHVGFFASSFTRRQPAPTSNFCTERMQLRGCFQRVCLGFRHVCGAR